MRRERGIAGRAKGVCGISPWGRFYGFCGVLFLLTGWCGAEGKTEDDGLRESLAAVAAAHHGKVALFAAQLNTGKTVAIDADVPVQTASVIKLTILFEAMEQVRAGKAKWDERITMPASYAVGWSGILTFFDAPMSLTTARHSQIAGP